MYQAASIGNYQSLSLAVKPCGNSRIPRLTCVETVADTGAR